MTTSLGMSRRELLTIAASMAMFVPLSLREVLAQTAHAWPQFSRHRSTAQLPARLFNRAFEVEGDAVNRALFDEKGRLLPGLSAAALEAERIARTLMKRDQAILTTWDGWRLDVGASLLVKLAQASPLGLWSGGWALPCGSWGKLPRE